MNHESAMTSTARALHILDCFSAAKPSLTLSEIARSLGQPLSSTHRQVGELGRWGALERGEDGRYSIGLHLWEVGSLAARSRSLREVSLPYMQDLYAATEQSVQVGVLDGHETVYVERIFGHNAAKTLARPGGRLPFHVTSIGRVISAYSTVREVDTLLSEPLTKMTRHTVAEPGALRREAAEIRRNGYAITCRQVDLVSMSVAAPIRGPENSVVAAISIIVPVHGQAARTFVPTVVAAAHGISRTLGARPRPAVVTGAAA